MMPNRALRSLAGLSLLLLVSCPILVSCKKEAAPTEDPVAPPLTPTSPATKSEDSVEKLLPRLQSSDEKTRYEASSRLSELGEPAVARLLDLLQKGPPLGRAMAAHAFARMEKLPAALRDGAVLPALVEAVRDADGEVRTQACRALGLLGEASPSRTSLTKALDSALSDPVASVSAAFALALLDPSSREAARVLGDALTRPEPPDSNLYQEACMRLESMGVAGEPAIHGVTRLLLHPEVDVRLTAIATLEKLASVAGPAEADLEKLTHSTNAEEARAAKQALAALARSKTPR